MTILRKVFRLARKILQVKKQKTYRRVIQGHHIWYEPIEWIVPVYKGEHWILALLGRRSHVSQGFVTSLKQWLKENEMRAISLGPEVKRPAEKKEVKRR